MTKEPSSLTHVGGEGSDRHPMDERPWRAQHGVWRGRSSEDHCRAGMTTFTFRAGLSTHGNMYMPNLTILGSGSYVPGEPVLNEHLARVMDTSDEWVRQRTGISARH